MASLKDHQSDVNAILLQQLGNTLNLNINICIGIQYKCINLANNTRYWTNFFSNKFLEWQFFMSKLVESGLAFLSFVRSRFLTLSFYDEQQWCKNFWVRMRFLFSCSSWHQLSLNTLYIYGRPTFRPTCVHPPVFVQSISSKPNLI